MNVCCPSSGPVHSGWAVYTTKSSAVHSAVGEGVQESTVCTEGNNKYHPDILTADHPARLVAVDVARKTLNSFSNEWE